MKIFSTPLKMIAVLILLLLPNLKAHCQTTQNQEDSVCLTAEDARIIFKDLQLFQLCDSIRKNQALQISHFKSVLITDEQIIRENNKRLSELKKSLSSAELKLKISRRLSTFGIPVAFGAGIITSILLFK